MGTGNVTPLCSGSGSAKFAKLQPQTLAWTISSNGSPVNDCIVTATLYAGRSQSDPDLEPGVAVPELENLVLEFTSNGVYAGEIGANFNPPASCNYVLVVDAAQPGSPPTPCGHWEEPATVLVNT